MSWIFRAGSGRRLRPGKARGSGASAGESFERGAENRIASQFDALVDADALHLSGMANASFYQHYPLSEYLV